MARDYKIINKRNEGDDFFFLVDKNDLIYVYGFYNREYATHKEVLKSYHLNEGDIRCGGYFKFNLGNWDFCAGSGTFGVIPEEERDDIEKLLISDLERKGIKIGK